MIKILTLGDKSFPINLIQGPLAGVSCAPFRRLIWRYSQPAYTCTEMISCKTIIHQPALALKRYVHKDPEEGPVCFQLSGSDPVELAEATKRVTAAGADLIDLNCGCPVKKIRGKGAGSRLLSDVGKMYQLISAMKANTHVPVSIKIRVDGGSGDRFNQAIAEMINDSGVDFIVVHGRHWTEHYETTCRYDDIAFFVSQLKVPVIGNGDIACVATLKKMFTTGCAGAMIARAGVGQPWLISRLIAEMNNEPYQPPHLAEIGQLYIEHVEHLQNLLGNEKFALLQARQFGKYYARVLPNKAEFCESVNGCERLSDFKSLVTAYFGTD